MLPGLANAGVVGTAHRLPVLKEVLYSLSLTTNLKLCLDAGDVNSFPSSTGTKWLDVSGNGYDFFRGADGSASSDDPAFNGLVAGQSANEFFSFDGGDRFVYDTTSESWMDALHKDNAKFSMVGWFRLVNSVTTIFGNSDAVPGVTVGLEPATDTLSFIVYRPPAFPAFSETISINVPTGDVFVGVRVDEAANTWAAVVNGTAVTGASCTYSSPSSAAAGGRMGIGDNGGGLSRAPSGTRVYAFAMYEQTALTTTQMISIYNASKAKFGL